MAFQRASDEPANQALLYIQTPVTVSTPATFTSNITQSGGRVIFDSATVRGVVTTTSGYVGSASSMTFNGQRYTFPPDDGSSGQVLETDGSGVLTWAADDTGGSGTAVRTYRVVIGTTSTFNADIVGVTQQAFSAAVSTLGGFPNGKGTIFVQGAGTIYNFSSTVDIPKNVTVLFEDSATVKSAGTPVFNIRGRLVNPTFDFSGFASGGWVTFSSGSEIIGGKVRAIMDNDGGSPIVFQVLNASNVVIDGLELTYLTGVGTANSGVFFDIQNSTGVTVKNCRFPEQDRYGHASDTMIRIRGAKDINIVDNRLGWKRRFLGMSNQSGQGIFNFQNIRFERNIITVDAAGVAADGMCYIDANENITYSSSVVFANNRIHFYGANTNADPFIFMDTDIAGKPLSRIDAPIVTDNIVTSDQSIAVQFLKIDTGVRKPLIIGNMVNNLGTFLNDLGASGVVNANNYLNGIAQ